MKLLVILYRLLQNCSPLIFITYIVNIIVFAAVGLNFVKINEELVTENYYPKTKLAFVAQISEGMYFILMWLNSTFKFNWSIYLAIFLQYWKQSYLISIFKSAERRNFLVMLVVCLLLAELILNVLFIVWRCMNSSIGDSLVSC